MADTAEEADKGEQVGGHPHGTHPYNLHTQSKGQPTNVSRLGATHMEHTRTTYSTVHTRTGTQQFVSLLDIGC